jgi:hypothetical protein
MGFMFTDAKRQQARHRIAITGPSGSGKTKGALLIAKGLGGSTFLIDTERDSAALYADQFKFKSGNLVAPYTPERFIEAIEAAEAAGADNIIIDGITPEWNGKGGILEIVDNLGKTMRGNTYAAWSEGTSRHRAFFDRMLSSRCHLIVTMRSKTAYLETEGRNGKKAYTKAGMAPEQRDGAEYEFSVVLDVVHDGHIACASKDRTELFTEPHVITEETGERLKAWHDTAEAAPEAPPEPEIDPNAKMTEADVEAINGVATGKQIAAIKQAYGVASLYEIPQRFAASILKRLNTPVTRAEGEAT